MCLQAVIIAIPAIHPTWARESLRLPPLEIENGDEDGDGDNAPHPQRIISYEPYRDNPGETEQDRQDRIREIAALNNDSRLAVRVERAREHPSRMMREAGGNEWEDA